MKRNLGVSLITLIALAFITSCSRNSKQEETTIPDTTYTLTVTMTGVDSGELELSYRKGDQIMRDTARSKTGIYTFSGQANEPIKAWLRVNGSKGNDWVVVYLENGKIDVVGTKDSLRKASVTGTRTNNEKIELYRATAPEEKRMEALNDAYGAADKSNVALMDSLDNAYVAIEKDLKQAKSNFIKEHPGSFLSAFEIRDMYAYNPDAREFESSFMLLDSVVRASEIGHSVEEMLAIAKRTDYNQVAPDFTLTDVNGKPVTLSSLRGKYLLIDFWASWCGPCRRENPKLVKTYNTYRKKGFTVVGVSLDDSDEKDKWIAAIKNDKLTWLQLSDLKGWDCEAGKIYGIQAIPMNFLLDPQGKIIGKGLMGKDLEAKLEEVLKTSI